MTSHHAVLLEAESPLQFEYVSTPDVSLKEAQLGIDAVRSLIQIAYRMPQTGEIQSILVATEFITEEAQQALLKIIEEPPMSTTFLFVVPKGYTLLPTLESRFERRLTDEGDTDQSVFESFLQLSYKERIAMIEDVMKKKDHKWQQALKQGLGRHLLRRRGQIDHETIRELEYVNRLLLTRGASNKFLLEHLALTLKA